jgi:hypothetical protein
MAIKYVDIEPEGEAKPKRTDKPRPRPEPVAEDGAATAPSGAPDLTHAKPTPKPRGRKKPLK